MKNAYKEVLHAFIQDLQEEVVNHVERVTSLTTEFVSQLPLQHSIKQAIILGARFHDIGKYKIMPHILYKQGKLTDEEYHHMKEHTTFGYSLFKEHVTEQTEEHEIIKNCILYHHESFDGSGYPKGIAGGNIPLEARILKITDVFEALTAERCYKKPWTYEEAISFLKEKRGTEFDPSLTDFFIHSLQENKKTKAI